MLMDPVRINLRLPFVIMAFVSFALFLGGPLVIAVTVLALAPLHISVWVALGCVVFTALLGYAMSSSYQWIELDGGMIRGRKMLTRRLVEKPVREIRQIVPLVSHVRGVANIAMDAILKTKNRGYLLRFRDGSKVGLVRGDMAGIDEFMEALRERLGERWSQVTSR
jgi:hypothetical protein